MAANSLLNIFISNAWEYRHSRQMFYVQNPGIATFNSDSMAVLFTLSNIIFIIFKLDSSSVYLQNME